MLNGTLSPELEIIVTYAKDRGRFEIEHHFNLHEFSMGKSSTIENCDTCRKAREVLKMIEKIENGMNHTYQEQVAERIKKGS